MARATKKVKKIYPHIRIEKYASQGKSIAYVDGRVLFVYQAIPEDVMDVQITKQKKDWAEAIVCRIVEPSPFRVTPPCAHFGTCGGCKWQMLAYEKQAEYKREEVADHIRRMAKMELPAKVDLLPAPKIYFYRNVLEYTFSSKRYLTAQEISSSEQITQTPALGFHAPRMFDKVVEIERCHLLDDKHNTIRNALRNFVLREGFTFYDARTHTGFLRNLRFRVSTLGEMMIVLVTAYEAREQSEKILSFLRDQFPALTSIYHIINPKKNDSLTGLAAHLYAGVPFIRERMGAYYFRIGPTSFFQTNTQQAERLYGVIKNYVMRGRNEKTLAVIYDLYCGAGTISMMLSACAQRVIGVELSEEAVENARRSAQENGLHNLTFIASDVAILNTDDWRAAYPEADMIVVNPPRVGLSKELVQLLLRLRPEVLIYSSCNSATQARDLEMLKVAYSIDALTVVDMFAHTHHIESVVRLQRKSNLRIEN